VESSYNPLSFEQEIYEDCEKAGSYGASSNPQSGQKTFLITMPPPNVTGALHMGHALFLSIQDAYIRWKRMRGYNALWLPGTDHAGIATQVMVEKQIEKEGSSRLKLGRDAFLKRVWEWKAEYGDTITEQMRAMGASCDWNRELFTMDEKSSRAVRESFARLFHEGLIYRGERIVNWSSGLQTAISDLEVEQKTTQGAFYFIKYFLADESGEYITIATTRPETIFADVAVAVHPTDERFEKFHGKEVLVPMTDRRVPIILDDYVDKKFGTGALKITPGHDVNDWNIGQRHHLKTLSTIGKDGKLNSLAGEFTGMVAAHSRKKIAEKLTLLGVLIKEEKHTYELGYCQRSGVVVEPLISQQWFIRMKPMAEPALLAAQGEDPALRFYPDYWKKTFFEWLNNIQDWCISRQLWWGHQIPAWHCEECGKITVPKSYGDADPEKCVHCNSSKIIQDPDVLDTWYSSSLWPISTLGWPEKTKDLEIFYPTLLCTEARKGREAKALMETGSDILFFWVARMVMMCSHFMEKRLPFEDVFLHAMVRDEKGQKMSKTKGNVIDPLDITEKHGSDSLRLTLLALSGQGRNVNLDLKRLEGYKGFINKLWNASRFSLMQIEERKIQNFSDPTKNLAKLDFTDRWLLQELNKTVASVNEHLSNYRPDAAFQNFYQFAWYEFCDWYLEMVKIKKSDSINTLCYALDTILKLFHPFAPLVTEKIFAELPWGEKNQLLHEVYPIAVETEFADAADLEKFSALKEIVEAVRNFRTENKIAPKQMIEIYKITSIDTAASNIWDEVKDYFYSLTKFSATSSAPSDAEKNLSIINTKYFTIEVSLDGLVDKDAERMRLQNEIKKVRSDVEFSEKRLANPGFVERAKPELVEKEKELLKIAQQKLTGLEEAFKKLA